MIKKTKTNTLTIHREVKQDLQSTEPVADSVYLFRRADVLYYCLLPSRLPQEESSVRLGGGAASGCLRR